MFIISVCLIYFQFTFHICCDYVDEWVIVSEDEISQAMFFMLQKHSKVSRNAYSGTFDRHIPKVFDELAQVFMSTSGCVDGMCMCKHA